MSYEYDVFVSYRRELLWTSWTRDHFKKLLTSYLQQELRRKPEIFVDERIDVEADYVQTLAEGLAKPRALVAIFSGDYFTSLWCLHELDLMLDRSGGNPGLILPVVVHDCEKLPAPLDRIQPANFTRFRTPYFCETGIRYEEFSIAVGALAPPLARVIWSAPVFRDDWVATCTTRLNAVHGATNGGTSPDYARGLAGVAQAVDRA